MPRDAGSGGGGALARKLERPGACSCRKPCAFCAGFALTIALNFLQSGDRYVGFDLNSRQHRLFHHRDRIRPGVRQPMSPIETVLGGVCALLLGAYLIYALIRPERF